MSSKRFRPLCATIVSLGFIFALLPPVSAVATPFSTMTATSKGVTWTIGRWWNATNNNYNWSGIVSDLDDMQRGNITWVKLSFIRNTAFSVYDQLLPLARARGINILGHVISPKRFYLATDSAYKSDYQSWLHNVVSRYKSDVRYWEIHNEPNLHHFWTIDEHTTDNTGYANSVADYLALLNASNQAIKGADSGAQVVLGGLASWKVERFVDELIRQNGSQYFDIIGYHPYPDWSQTTPDGVIDELNKLRGVLARQSSLASKAIWITEIGFNTVARAPAPVADEGKKAAYLVDMMQKLRSNGITYPIHWYNLNEDATDNKTRGWDLIRKDSNTLQTTYLPAYEAYRKLWTGEDPLPPTSIPAGASAVTITANTDTYVDSAIPGGNFGANVSLLADGEPHVSTYLKFDLSQLSGVTIDALKLRIKVAPGKTTGSVSQQFVRTCSTNWTEGTMTYNTRPATSQYTSGGGLQFTAPNQWYDVNLYLPDVRDQTGKMLCIALESVGSDAFQIQSKETVDKPQLLVTYHISPKFAAKYRTYLPGARR